MLGQFGAGQQKNLIEISCTLRKQYARNNCLGCIFALIGCFYCFCHLYSNNYAFGGQMKITLEFDDFEDAKKAIHVYDAWIALTQISEALRSHTKHDVSEKQTIANIQEIMSDVNHLLYS